jgi:hypothetical protein
MKAVQSGGLARPPQGVIWKRGGAMKELLIDLVCMVYHEARNVRFPIEMRRVPDAARFAHLVDLPKPRLAAWQQMQSLRTKAASVKPGTSISTVFEGAYELRVSDLAELFERPIWKNSSRGGNAWGGIARKVQATLNAYADDRQDACTALVSEIVRMRHNNGTVEEKLSKLKGA